MDFSLSFFKSKKKKQLEIEQAELEIAGQKLKNDLLQKELDRNFSHVYERSTVSPREVEFPKKLYSSLKLVNDVITVTLQDGSVISKPNATTEDFKAIKSATTEEEIMNVVADKEVVREKVEREQKVKKIQTLQKGIEILGKFADFEVKENSVYLVGTNRSIPQLLVEEFLQIVQDKLWEDLFENGEADYKRMDKELLSNEKYQSLKRFFMWCCLNPRAEVADQLYNFLKTNSFRITSQGFFVALRNVVTVNSKQDNTLVKFISNSYNKIKAVWKKNPSNYWVWEYNGEYNICNYEPVKDRDTNIIGNLQDLYIDLPNMKENRFTDAHTRTFDIRVGQVVNMPMEKCNWSTADCAHAGLKSVASL